MPPRQPSRRCHASRHRRYARRCYASRRHRAHRRHRACLGGGLGGSEREREGGGGGVLPGLHPAFMPFAFVDFEEIVLNVWNIQVAKF